MLLELVLSLKVCQVEEIIMINWLHLYMKFTLFVVKAWDLGEFVIEWSTLGRPHILLPINVVKLSRIRGDHSLSCLVDVVEKSGIRISSTFLDLLRPAITHASSFLLLLYYLSLSTS